jgi:hypothetical protein
MRDQAPRTGRIDASGPTQADGFGFCGAWNEAILSACATARIEADGAGNGPRRGLRARCEPLDLRAIATSAA